MKFDVCALGSALVDVLAFENADFLARLGLDAGVMNMVDAARSDEIYAQMGPATEQSGGSAGNTIAGVASFGGAAAFIGRVADDTFGKVYTHDLRSLGVHFEPQIATDVSTGRCLVIVAADADRTMCTYLGAANGLDADAVEPDVVAGATVTYLEGYLWDLPEAKSALQRAAECAHTARKRVAFTLSDPFCVDRHRDEFRELVAGHVDIVFANEDEITMLYEVDSFDAALEHVRRDCQIAALTRGALGSVIVAGDEVHKIAAAPADVVDTTGAGDLYAAGFLFGLSHGHDVSTCGQLASLAAAEVISHVGGRPATSLAKLAAPLLQS